MKRSREKKAFKLSYKGRSLEFTALGTRFVLVCIGVGFAAVNSGSNLLYLVTAMMLSLMIVSGVLSEQSLKGIRVGRSLPSELYANTPFPVRYNLENKKRSLSSFGLAVSAGGAGRANDPAAFVPRLAPGGRGYAELTETIPRRGRLELSGYTVSTRFPFGLFRKSALIPARETRTVYPQLRPLGRGISDSLGEGTGELPARRTGQGTDIRSVREYTPSDDARLIHWKSSARLSALMVKEFEAQERTGVVLALDNRSPDAPGPGFEARFEEAVSLAASLARHVLLELDIPLTLITRDEYVPEGAGRAQFIAAMEALAGVSPTRETGGPPAHGVPEGAFVVVVTVDKSSPWPSYSGTAGLVLEAGNEV